MRFRTFLVLAILLPGMSARGQQTVTVAPSEETQPVIGTGTVVQGAAMWMHPTDPSNSLLLVADNQTGLLLYRLDGTLKAQISEGAALGVDVQEGFPVGGITQPLVMVANQTLQGLVGYVVDPTSLSFRRAGLATINVAGFQPSSVALYASPTSGRFYAFAGSSTGVVRQFELTAQTDGGTGSTEVRALNVGGAVVGLAVDDAQRTLYVVQQDVGIWQYGAEPDAADARTSVDVITGGGLSQPLGGVALYLASGSQGYLLAANGGNDTVRIYDRAPGAHTFRGSFAVGQDGGIDPVERPRHVVVTNRPLGTLFPSGLVAVHDSANPASNENFKLVPWQTVANAFSPSLVVDTGPGGTDAGTTDGGSEDGGFFGGVPTGPSGQVPEGFQPGTGQSCNCASASVPGSVLLVLASVLLFSRRRA